MIVERDGIVQDGEHLHIVIVKMLQHLINIPLHPGDLRPIGFHVFPYHLKGFFKMRFFLPSLRTALRIFLIRFSSHIYLRSQTCRSSRY